MSIMKKLLRGIYYFFIGIKNAFLDFVDWYTGNRHIPGIFRNKVTLVIIGLAIIAGIWGLIVMIGNAGDTRRDLPAMQNSSDTASVEPVESTASEAPVESSSSEIASSEAVSSSQPAIDAMASATRFTPLTAEQLTTEIAARAKKYYTDAAASGTIFIPPPAGDIAAWKEVNSDVMGWITVSSTNINYPVLKGPYTDYYTHRNIHKGPDRNGVIWVDTDTQIAANGAITSQNTVIYGHNWTNCWRPVQIGRSTDVMFGQIAAYDNAAFAAANPYIRLATADGDHVYQIFSVFYTTTQFAYNYADGARIPGIISKAKSLSIHPFDVPMGANDKFLTISTCTRVTGPGDDQRFVIMAKKIS